MKKEMLAIVLVAAFAPSLHAADGASIYAGWRDLSFSLVDLDPADGVDPSMNVWLDRQCVVGDVFVCSEHLFRADYRPPSAVSILNGSALGMFQPVALGHQSDRIEFELSPNTGLVVTGTLFTSGTSHEHLVVLEPDGSLMRYDAYAWGNVQVNLGGGSGPFGVSFLDSDVGARDMPFSWQLNSSSSTLNSSFEIGLKTWGYSTGSLVPEPSTYALMLAGMGLVAWAGRRRRA